MNPTAPAPAHPQLDDTRKAETEAVLAKLKELREDSGTDLIAAAKLEAAVLKLLAELPEAAN